MSTIFEPRYLNLPEQVQKNKKDIEKLFGRLIELFNTQQVLSTDTTSIQKSLTNIGTQTYENGFIIDTTGNVFKINAENETQDLLYIEYYTTISGAQGPRGLPGQNGQNGQDGAPGANAGFGTPTASATTVTGNPTVTITSSGPDTAKVFNFDFGIPKGEQGEPGQSIVGPRGPQGVPGQSIQGPQGVPGEPGRDGNSFVVTGSVVSVNDLPDASTTPAGTAYFVGGTYPRPVYVVVESEGNKIWQNQGTLQGPRGLQGIQGVAGQDGQDGIGVTFMGAWLSGQTYYYNDQVTYTENGVMSSYILINENGLTSTTPPPQDATNWQPSSRGVAGPQGTAGTSAGFGTPTASATSVTGDPTVTVTSSGPDTAKVFNFQFGIPGGGGGATLIGSATITNITTVANPTVMIGFTQKEANVTLSSAITIPQNYINKPIIAIITNNQASGITHNYNLFTGYGGCGSYTSGIFQYTQFIYGHGVYCLGGQSGALANSFQTYFNYESGTTTFKLATPYSNAIFSRATTSGFETTLYLYALE